MIPTASLPGNIAELGDKMGAGAISGAELLSDYSTPGYHSKSHLV